MTKKQLAPLDTGIDIYLIESGDALPSLLYPNAFTDLRIARKALRIARKERPWASYRLAKYVRHEMTTYTRGK